ncbi:MAG: helix-turn-helix transcriptional regulator, partial [Lachnospiraceae bacterium]|nr:helix-turn-helix transcriptional regulator [Lachnospiraceae bacterium]
TQLILKPMVLALFMHIARRYRLEKSDIKAATLSESIVGYINSHPESVTLKDISAHFSYHPNYISSLLHKELGKTFSEIVLEKRMDRALIMLKGTTLSIEEISSMLGYTNTSNFYKAFRAYYGKSPREYTGESR